MKLETAIERMEALKAAYEAELPYHRRRVICTKCGAEYQRVETENEFVWDMVKACDCKADGKVMDAERSNP